MMFFAGIPKILNPEWTAAEFLAHAKTFPTFYAWFAEPMNLLWIDPLNAWGITLVGAALLIGVCVRPAAYAGAALMLLYYFPHVAFPYVDHGFVVEEHVIYAAGFLVIALIPEAARGGLGPYLKRTWLGKISILGKYL